MTSTSQACSISEAHGFFGNAPRYAALSYDMHRYV